MNSLITVGGSLSSPSKFRSLCYGIRAIESSVYGNNTQWDNINVAYLYPGESPAGVRSVAINKVRSLIVAGLGVGTGSPLTFNNCLIGAYADGINLDVKNCRKDSMIVGIFQQNGSNRSTYVFNNDIQCAVWGISCKNNMVPTSFILSRNIISFEHSKSTLKFAGISVEGFSGVDSSNIYQNKVSTFGARYGIEFRSVKALQGSSNLPYRYLDVALNEVTMNAQTDTARGVALYGAAFGLHSNQVAGTSDGTAQNLIYNSDGYYANMSPSFWCCNSVESVYNCIFRSNLPTHFAPNFPTPSSMLKAV